MVEAVIDFERGVSHAARARGCARGEGERKLGHAGQAEEEPEPGESE